MILDVKKKVVAHTPGSEADACKKEDTETRSKYAKRMGIAGETLSQSQGALLYRLAEAKVSEKGIGRTRNRRKGRLAEL